MQVIRGHLQRSGPGFNSCSLVFGLPLECFSSLQWPKRDQCETCNEAGYHAWQRLQAAKFKKKSTLEQVAERSTGAANKLANAAASAAAHVSF